MFALLQLLVLFIGLSGYHGAHTHLLIKVHKPTSAMLHRFCHLNDERVASDFLADLHVQHYMPADIVEMPFRWCLPYSILHKDNLTTLWGNESSIMHAKRWELSGISELSFFAINFLANASTLDFLWVIEQDVAWQGNLFDILATFATWTEDLLCLRPDVGRVGDSWVHSLTHSGWANNTPGAPRPRCQVFVVRYSRRLLLTLVNEYLAKGHYAQVEWFAPTVCTLHMSNCTVRDYSTEQVFGRPFGCCETPYNETMWNYSLSHDASLFHPVKFLRKLVEQ